MTLKRISGGRRDSKGNVILRGGQGGIHKISCPNCGNPAPAGQVSGQAGYACSRCGAKFKAVRM